MKTDSLIMNVDQNRTSSSVMSSTTTCSNNNLNDDDFDENSFETTTKMQTILDEFSKLYNDKMKRIDSDNVDTNIQKKVTVLESWVEDLAEQNSVLVSTVEELEKEARSRVALLQEKLEKMAIATKESCVSLRDHQNEISSLLSQKIFAEDEVDRLKESLLEADRTNSSIVQENTDLTVDLDTIIEIITDIRLTGRYQETRSFEFKCIKRERVFGTDSTLSLNHLNERLATEGNKSRKDSLSSYGSQGSTDIEDEIAYKKVKTELKVSRHNNKKTNALLIQRDEHITDLQSQLTDLHHQLAVIQTDVDNSATELQTLKDRGRRDTFEICRRDDVIRQLLSPSRTLEGGKTNFREKFDMEIQLGENIDVMAARLVDFEEECQQLRHENVVIKASHAHCTPTINQLQDQLNNSHKSLDDLRLVLTTEVTERYDHSMELTSRLTELRQQHQEELDSKNDSIISLQEQLKDISKDFEKNVLENHKDFTTQSAQTEQLKKIGSTDGSWLGDSKLLNFSIQLSRLENEVSEKNILLRELQNHLSTSRHEIYLKDETLYNIEKKLDSSRRDHDEKEDRMMYLTSQLTILQTEVSKLHGTAQQLQLQLENKSKLVHKLEAENDSLCWQLNEKSALVEKMQKDFAFFDKDIRKKKREITDQKMTITTLQDALVSTKQTCDKLRKQFDIESGSRYASLASLPPSVLSSTYTLDSSSITSGSEPRRDSTSQFPSLFADLRSYSGSSNLAPLSQRALSQECPDVLSFLSDRDNLSSTTCSLTSEPPLTLSSSTETNKDSLKSLDSESKVTTVSAAFSHQQQQSSQRQIYDV